MGVDRKKACLFKGWVSVYPYLFLNTVVTVVVQEFFVFLKENHTHVVFVLGSTPIWG